MDRKPIIVVQGAQWGSEAKGTIAAYLCVTRKVDIAVRTGGINAGHTVIHEGKTYKMQQLPTGWVNPETELVLAAGAYINPQTLFREIDMVDDVMGRGTTARRLIIDTNAGYHGTRHMKLAEGEDRHTRIGATGKGVSEAIIDKIKNRGNGAIQFIEHMPPGGWPHDLTVTDTSTYLNRCYDRGGQIIIEGTQGHFLDLHYGPWPYTTGKQTVVSTWLAECGLSPRLEYEIVSVARTYPIRVAGNSGPMADEITWPILAREINAKLASYGMDARVKEESIREFEGAQRLCAANHTIPEWSDGTDQHKWTVWDQENYATALSQLNADAMRCVKENLPEVYDDLTSHLFEFTTVTGKPRRIARFNNYDMSVSCLRDRPSWVAVTFLNYEYPVLWNGRAPDLEHYWSSLGLANYLGDIARHAGAPVRIVNMGPTLDNIVQVHVDATARRGSSGVASA